MDKILNFLEKRKTLIVAFAIIVLFLALKKKVTNSIVDCLVPIFGFDSSTPLDIFFGLVAIGLLFTGIQLFYPHKKIVNDNYFAVSAVLVTIYLFYRINAEYFVFARFFNSCVAYMDVFALYLLVYVVSWIIDRTKFNKFWNSKKSSTQDTKDSEGKSKFTADYPIKLPGEDIFVMNEQINRLVDYLDEVDVNDYAFSLGLSGKWGCGKSSIFNLMRVCIKELKKDYIIVDFNPRTSKNPELIQEDFLRTLKRQLKPYHTGLNKYFSDYADSLNLSGDMPAIFGLIVGLFRTKSKDWNESFNTINDAIKEIGKKIIVFVDDLDRLTGEEIMEVMKIIGKNASFSKVVYVSSYDKLYINEALAGYLKLDKDIVFTDKYFNAEIEVPMHTYEKRADYLKWSCKLSWDTELSIKV